MTKSNTINIKITCDHRNSSLVDQLRVIKAIWSTEKSNTSIFYPNIWLNTPYPYFRQSWYLNLLKCSFHRMGFLRRRASSDSPRREPFIVASAAAGRPFSPRRTSVSNNGYYKICFVNGYVWAQRTRLLCANQLDLNQTRKLLHWSFLEFHFQIVLLASYWTVHTDYFGLWFFLY